MVDIYAVASGKRGVGKTVTVAALGDALADAGHAVLLVDFDLTSPDLGAYLGLDADEPTVHDVLAGDVSLDDAVRSTPTGVSLLSGSRTADAFATVDPSGLHELAERAEAFDVVLLDTGRPTAPDTSVALDAADGTLVVSTPGRIARQDSAILLEHLDDRGNEPIGTVLTRVEDGSDPEPLDRDAPELGRIPEIDGDQSDLSFLSDAPEHPLSLAAEDLATGLIDSPKTTLGIDDEVVAEDQTPVHDREASLAGDAVTDGSGDDSRDAADADTAPADRSAASTDNDPSAGPDEDSAPLVTTRRALVTLVMGLVGAFSTGLLGPSDVENAAPTESVPDVDGFGYGGTPLTNNGGTATTESPTATATRTATSIAANDETATPTATATESPATTPTDTVTAIPTDTSTATPTDTPTPTPTPDSPSPAAAVGGGGGGGGSGQSTPPADSEMLPPPTANITVERATLPSGTVTAGEPVELEVTVWNRGAQTDQFTFVLAANGTTLAEETVAVAANTTQTIPLEVTVEEPGTYTVTLNGEPVGELRVTPATAEPTPPADPTEETVSSPSESPDGVDDPVSATDSDGSPDEIPSTVPGNDAETIPDPDASASAPGFSLLVGILAVLLFAGVAAWWRRPS